MFLNGGDALSGLGDASQSVRHLVTCPSEAISLP